MDLQQQVKNSYTTQKLFNTFQRNTTSVGTKNVAFTRGEEVSYAQGLRSLSKGASVPYDTTFRIVTHDGGRALLQESQQTRKHPGYIRNEFGGFFTS